MTPTPPLLGTLFAVLVGASVVVSCGPAATDLGPVDDEFVVSSATLEIRVTRRPELEGPVPGAHYAFESRRSGAAQWSPITSIRHDDPVDLPSDRIHFVDGNTAYLSMCSSFAATTDGGASWHVWRASDVEWSRALVNYGLIESVFVAANGEGTMTLNDVAVRRGGPHLAVTTDFGRSWLPAPTPN